MQQDSIFMHPHNSCQFFTSAAILILECPGDLGLDSDTRLRSVLKSETAQDGG